MNIGVMKLIKVMEKPHGDIEGGCSPRFGTVGDFRLNRAFRINGFYIQSSLAITPLPTMLSQI